MYLAFFTSVILSHPLVTMPMHTYNNTSNGIMVEVQVPEGFDTAKVLLLDYENNLLAPPASMTTGKHDLVSRIPEISNLKKAAWLQTYIEHVAVGSPIVIQPMTSREVPIVEDTLRPDGKSMYPKIVGWVDEAEAEEDEIQTPFVSGWRVYMDQDAVIATSEGDIRVAFRPDAAPNTVWNFRELASGGFYHNTTFHRIVPMTSKGHPFVIQGGDPTGTGSGGPGYWLPIEHSELPHDVGVISMARAGDPDSAGSQFFFCLSRAGTARLDGQYCAFGETVVGEDVIQKIAATPLADPASGKPVTPPKIHLITLVPAKFREVQLIK